MGKGVVEVDSPPLHPPTPTTHVWGRSQAPREAQGRPQELELSEDSQLVVDDVVDESSDPKALDGGCGCLEGVQVDEVLEEQDPQVLPCPCEPA